MLSLSVEHKYLAEIVTIEASHDHDFRGVDRADHWTAARSEVWEGLVVDCDSLPVFTDLLSGHQSQLFNWLQVCCTIVSTERIQGVCKEAATASGPCLEQVGEMLNCPAAWEIVKCARAQALLSCSPANNCHKWVVNFAETWEFSALPRIVWQIFNAERAFGANFYFTAQRCRALNLEYSSIIDLAGVPVLEINVEVLTFSQCTICSDREHWVFQGASIEEREQFAVWFNFGMFCLIFFLHGKFQASIKCQSFYLVDLG